MAKETATALVTRVWPRLQKVNISEESSYSHSHSPRSTRQWSVLMFCDQVFSATQRALLFDRRTVQDLHKPITRYNIDMESPQTDSLLFKLPPELRVMIYGCVFEETTIPLFKTSHTSSVLGTCRIIRRETHNLLYKTTAFHADEPADIKPFLALLSPNTRALITYVNRPVFGLTDIETMDKAEINGVLHTSVAALALPKTTFYERLRALEDAGTELQHGVVRMAGRRVLVWREQITRRPEWARWVK